LRADDDGVAIRDVADKASLTAFFRSNFDAYSREKMGGASANFAMWAFEAVDPATGARLGAIEGKMFWGGLFISLLMVDKVARGRGVGGALLAAALSHGREAGCTVACVETMDFQAPWLYERHGFEADFIRRGFANGHSMYYFSRPL
jgi:GNAT superfamily N-acetyltransferase